MTDIHFGTESEYINISLPSSFSDEGWGQAIVEIAVRGFRGIIHPWVETGDFERFTTQLRAMYESLEGQAEFCPLEKQFVLKLVAKSGGHVQASGEAWSQATYENKLEFELQLDQSYLLAPLQDLESLVFGKAKNAV
jgi:hypothetical protein